MVIHMVHSDTAVVAIHLSKEKGPGRRCVDQRD
jgi:hypothetical protein